MRPTLHITIYTIHLLRCSEMWLQLSYTFTHINACDVCVCAVYINEMFCTQTGSQFKFERILGWYLVFFIRIRWNGVASDIGWIIILRVFSCYGISENAHAIVTESIHEIWIENEHSTWTIFIFFHCPKNMFRSFCVWQTISGRNA